MKRVLWAVCAKVLANAQASNMTVSAFNVSCSGMHSILYEFIIKMKQKA